MSGLWRQTWLRVWVGGAATIAVVLISVAGLFVAHPAHADSTTIITFDDLAAGTIVANQYESEGVELGYATGFGWAAAPGGVDCSSPSVESAVTAASAPNYAELVYCTQPGTPQFYAETFGFLSGGAADSLSVQVSDLSPAGGEVAMSITGYDASHAEVASGTATATSGSWTTLTAAPTGSSASISYFQIRSTDAVSDAALEQPVGIDNLTFAKAGGGGGGTPTAVGTVDTADPTGGQPVTLDGTGSTPGGAPGSTIVSYNWDFNNDGRTDTSTGTNPHATFIFPPGQHIVALTVTNSGGTTSNPVPIKFTTAPPPISAPLPDGGQGNCTSTYDDGDVHIIADCIQTLSGGGWVIETKLLDLNGMTLAPRGGGYGVFTISKFNELGIGSGTRLSGPVVDVELLNTPIGNMDVGGIDLTANPMQLTFKAFVPPVIHLGNAVVTHHTAHRPVANDDDSDTGKTLLASFGVGESCSSAGKNPACCPQSGGASACATLPGDFPLTGQVKVYLNNKGQSLFDVQVALDLKAVGFEATGSLEVVADPTTGINLNSLQFTIPQAGIADIFSVKDASFVYYFPSDPDASKRDTWQAKGKLIFGPLSQPSLAAELDFKAGQFSYASMVFTAPTGTGVPIYPGILLNQLGGSIGVNPLQFGGQLGASIAAELELSLAFKYRDATDTTLGFFGGQGSLSLSDDQIASLSADVYSDGYTDAELKLSLKYPSDDPVVSANGDISFWDEPSSGRWEADGSVTLKLWVISAEVAALINNNYIAGCADIGGFGAQARYAFADSSINGGFFGFSNCSDQLKQYKQTPVTQHSGGFVGSLRGANATAGGRGAGAATAKYQTIHIAGGQPGVELKLEANAANPTVTLISPSGKKYSTPTTTGTVTKTNGKFIAAISPDTHQVLVFLHKPQGGAWKVVETAGDPKITKVAQAGDAPPATVHIHVSRRHGRQYSLQYRINHYLPGTAVQFVERGHDSTDVIGTARHAHGRFTFRPQDALGRTRTVYAYLRSTTGAPQRTLKVGSYRAPAAVRPTAVRHIRFARTAGSKATLSWSPAQSVRRYRITIRGSDGRRITAFNRPNQRTLTIRQVLPAETYTATVVPQGGPNLLSGRGAKARLRAIAAAKVDFLQCKPSKCTLSVAKVATGPIVATAREVHVTVRHGKKIFGAGIANALAHPAKITLNARRPLTKGRYVVTLTYRHAGHLHTAHESVTIA